MLSYVHRTTGQKSRTTVTIRAVQIEKFLFPRASSHNSTMNTLVKYSSSQKLSVRLLFLTIPIFILSILIKSRDVGKLATMTKEGSLWADTPIRLISTPQYQTGKSDIFTKGATHMALLHNAILRGYNSIYQQALHIEPSEHQNFIGYCLTWFKFVKTHHDDEEKALFIKVEDLLGDSEIWGETHKEHGK